MQSRIRVTDTPGLCHDTGCIPFKQALEIRNALIMGTTSLIVVTTELPTSKRATDVLGGLDPVDKLMKCRTFSYNDSGQKLGFRDDAYTKVLLMITKMDQSNPTKSECDELAQMIFNSMDWVGDIMFIALPKAGHFALNEISDQARWKSKRAFAITDNEFVNRFPLQDVLSKQQRRIVESLKISLQNAGAAARVALTEQVNMRENGRLNGEMFGQHVDLIFQFLDDTWLEITENALEAISRKSQEQLWCDCEVASLINNLELQNSVKRVLLPEYTQQRATLKQLLPSHGSAVIYRKCTCGRVYVKPRGCDGETTCGSRLDNQLSDVITYDYEYRAGSLHFVPRSGTGKKNTNRILRGLLSRAVDTILQIFWPSRQAARAPSPVPVLAPVPQGCGRAIVWSAMEPVDLGSTNEGEIMDMSAPYDCAALAQRLERSAPSPALGEGE